MAGDVLKIVAENKEIKLKISVTRIILNGFLSGLAWGFGSVIGATLVVALILFFLSQLDTSPIIGKYIKSVIESINNAPTIK